MTYIDDGAAHDFLTQWNDGKTYIIAHTSGSTGSPKPIRLLKKDMLVSARATCEYFNIHRGSTLVCPLSANYIAGKMMIVRAIVSGAALHMIKPSNHPAIESFDHIDLMPIVPSQIPGLLDATRPGLIDNVIIGGAPLSPRDEITVSSARFRAYSTYGMTETCSHVALRHISGDSNIYEALPGYRFDTDDRSCLIIKSDVQSFGTIITNDIVKLHDNSHFEWLGRFDNVIISGGLKVHPEIVERIISRYIDVCFYIKGMPDDKWGQHVCLVIEGSPFDYTSLLDKLKCELKKQEMPCEVLFIPVFERTSSGKIKRL